MNCLVFVEWTLSRLMTILNTFRSFITACVNLYIQSHCVKSVQIHSFFWSVFSCIRTEYGYLRSKSPYSVRVQENKDQKKLRIRTLFRQCKLQICALKLLEWFSNTYMNMNSDKFLLILSSNDDNKKIDLKERLSTKRKSKNFFKFILIINYTHWNSL